MANNSLSRPSQAFQHVLARQAAIRLVKIRCGGVVSASIACRCVTFRSRLMRSCASVLS